MRAGHTKFPRPVWQASPTLDAFSRLLALFSFQLTYFFCCQDLNKCICKSNYGGFACSKRLDRTGAVFSPVGDLMTGYGPSHRTGHSLASCDDGSLYMFGGYSFGFGIMNDLWKFDSGSYQWTLLRPATDEEPEPRFVWNPFLGLRLSIFWWTIETLRLLKLFINISK